MPSRIHNLVNRFKILQNTKSILKNCPRLLNFCKSSKISLKMVTLIPSPFFLSSKEESTILGSGELLIKRRIGQRRIKQRTLTVGGFTRLHKTASLNTNKIIFPSLVSSSLVKLETSRTVILPPTVSVLWFDACGCGIELRWHRDRKNYYFCAPLFCRIWRQM